MNSGTVSLKGRWLHCPSACSESGRSPDPPAGPISSALALIPEESAREAAAGHSTQAATTQPFSGRWLNRSPGGLLPYPPAPGYRGLAVSLCTKINGEDIRRAVMETQLSGQGKTPGLIPAPRSTEKRTEVAILLCCASGELLDTLELSGQ